MLNSILFISEPWCNGSTRKKGYPAKDTVSKLQNSIHKDVIVVRIHGAPPFIASADGAVPGLLSQVIVVRIYSEAPVIGL